MGNEVRHVKPTTASAANGLKQGSRRLGKRIAYGIAIGILIFIVARIAAKIVGAEMVGWFIVIVGPILFGYFVLWPQLNRLVSGIFGFLFWEEKPLEDAPVMSLAQGLRRQERFKESMAEYRKVVEAFPETKTAYLEMIDMAVRDMKDEALGHEVLLRATVVFDAEDDRRELQDRYDCACATMNKEEPSETSRKIAFDDFDDDEGIPFE